MNWNDLIDSARSPRRRNMQDLFRHLRHHADPPKKKRINEFCGVSYWVIVICVILISVCGYLIGLLLWWLPNA